jgi:hypothetical protein
MGAGVIRMDLVHDDINAGFESFFQNLFLFGVIMATTARDQERPQWFCFRGARGKKDAIREVEGQED